MSISLILLLVVTLVRLAIFAFVIYGLFAPKSVLWIAALLFGTI